MNFSINWILGLFKKPEIEISFNKEPWPFPIPTKKRKPQVKKATTRKPKVATKPAVKKAKKAK